MLFMFSLMVFVFTVLGVQLFGQLDTSGSDARFKFADPFSAFLTVCSLFSGEDWADIAVHVMLKSDSWVAYLYFLAAFVMGQWLLVSLLVSTFVDAFTESRRAHEDLVQRVRLAKRAGFVRAQVRPGVVSMGAKGA